MKIMPKRGGAITTIVLKSARVFNLGAWSAWHDFRMLKIRKSRKERKKK